jgi:hypothetical protein
MIDFFDMIHGFIGLAFVVIALWALIKMHDYFSKDNIIIGDAHINKILATAPTQGVLVKT